MASERSALEHIRGQSPSETFHLSREERDHAGHALDSMNELGGELMEATNPHSMSDKSGAQVGSNATRKIAALSNLLGDIGWERSEARPLGEGYLLGELFPVAQLRPWLEEWQRQDNEALVEVEKRLLSAEITAESGDHDDGYVPKEKERRRAIAAAQTKLGTGAILLARIEKWMACKEN